MRQKQYFSRAVILLTTILLSLAVLFSLCDISDLFSGEKSPINLLVIFLLAALLVVTILAFLLAHRYRSKVREILILRKMLSDFRNDKIPFDVHKPPWQVTLTLFHLLLKIATAIHFKTQGEEVTAKQFPIVLRNSKNEKLLLNADTIEWVKAAGNIQEIQTCEGVFTARHTMKDILLQLQARSKSFVRVHRSWIINSDRVQVISPTWEYVKIRGKLISISPSCKEDLSDRLFLA